MEGRSPRRRLLIVNLERSEASFMDMPNLVRTCFVYIMANNGGETQTERTENAKIHESESPSATHTIELDHETFTRPGAQLSDKQIFTNKKGQSVTGYPVIVDFRRLLQLSLGHSKAHQKEHGIIYGVLFTFLYEIHKTLLVQLSVEILNCDKLQQIDGYHSSALW